MSKKGLPKPKTALTKNYKPKVKQKTPTITTLRRKADALYGHYIRLRDAELYGIQWIGQCISCEKEYIVRWFDEDKQKWRWGKRDNIGHFVGRSYYFLRYDDINCNLQCVRCNKWKSGNNAAYHKALDNKYGAGTAQELIDQADANKDYPLKRTDLERVIKAATEYLNWCYDQEKYLAQS